MSTLRNSFYVSLNAVKNNEEALNFILVQRNSLYPGTKIDQNKKEGKKQKYTDI